MNELLLCKGNGKGSFKNEQKAMSENEFLKDDLTSSMSQRRAWRSFQNFCMVPGRVSRAGTQAELQSWTPHWVTPGMSRAFSGAQFSVKINKKISKPVVLYPLNMRAPLFFIVKKCPNLSYDINCTFNHQLMRKRNMNSEMFSDEFGLCYSSVNIYAQMTLMLITRASIYTWKICVRLFIWLACSNDHS